MDLLIVSHTPPYPLNSAGRALLYHLSRVFAQKRYSLDLLYFYDAPEVLASSPRYESYYRQVQAFRQPPISAKRLGAAQSFPDRAEKAGSKELWELGQKWVQERNYLASLFIGGPEIYEYRALRPGLPAAILSPQLESLRLEALLEQKQPSRKQAKELKAALAQAQAYEAWLYTKFQALGVITQAAQAKLAALYPDKNIELLPMGIDADYYLPTGHEPRQPALLFTADYSHPAALAAAKRLCERLYPPIKRAIPGLKLMIVGANPPPELQALASESILVTGYVPDLRPYFELASLFISPLSASLGVSQDILKAVSMLTPVVATPASLDNLAAFEANLHLLVGESDDELIRHSIRLLREEQTRLNLSILAREALLQHYSWEQVALRYEAFVRGVAG